MGKVGSIILSMEILDLVIYSYEQGKHVLEKRGNDSLKKNGQFLTPPAVARYMAKQLGKIQDGDVLLEPAIGSSVLVCAVIERLIEEKRPLKISLIAYELDEELCEISRQVLEIACQKAEIVGIKIHWQVIHEDFILACLPEQ